MIKRKNIIKAKDVANPDYLTELLMKGMLFVKL